VSRDVLEDSDAEDSADPVCSCGGDVDAAPAIAGSFLHSFECAERAAVQNALLCEQDVLR
jgi:hypothetical protein